MVNPVTFQWDQSAFDAFQAARDPEMVAADERRLSEIFSRAAESPTFKKALGWAQKNGVKFFIDRSTTAGGYYNAGSGVVAIAERNTEDFGVAAQVLTHEIRHAWQDSHGFIPTVSRNFVKHNTQTALIEADAYAWQRKAACEIHYAEEKKEHPLFARVERFFNKLFHFLPWGRREELRLGFYKWYRTGTAGFYGVNCLQDHARTLNVFVQGAREFKDEFHPPLRASRGIDVSCMKTVLGLGRDFDGKGPSYLRKAFLDRALSFPRSRKFFGWAKAQDRALVDEVRRRQAQVCRHENRALHLS